MGKAGREGSVVARRYVPDAGDLIWPTFDLQAEREQAGRRRASVLSPGAYNAKSGLALVCPITGRVKAYPFEVALPRSLTGSGVVLADQLKRVDWRERCDDATGGVPV